MRALHTRARDERGESTISLLMGLALGSMVISALLSYTITAMKTAQVGHESAVTHFESITALNRIGRDIQDAKSVLYADADEIVVEKPRQGSDGEIDAHPYQWVRYHLADDALLVRQFISRPVTDDRDGDGAPDPVVGAEYSHTAGWWDGVPTQRLAEVPSGSVFSYVGTDGLILAADLLPMDRVAARSVRRVTIEAGVTTAAAITQAAVNPSPGGARPRPLPTCPEVTTEATGDETTLSWTGVEHAYAYTITRDGAPVETVSAAPGEQVSWSTSAPGSYAVAPFGAGGSPGTC